MNLKRPIVSLVLVGLCTISAAAQSPDAVKWIREKEDPSLWAAIRADFHDELQPDDPAKVAPVVAYSYKYIYRIATYDRSALVIVGHRETQESKVPGYYSAFNYDVASHARTAIKGGAEVFSLFKFVRFATVDSASPPDIVYTWMTCTECEASQILSAFHYDTGIHNWVVRRWEATKDVWWTGDSGPVISADVSASDTISFDCLHGFVNGDTSYGIRCREVTESDGGQRTTTDVTVRYRFSGAESKLEILKGEDRAKVLADLCQQFPRNKLCAVPYAR